MGCPHRQHGRRWARDVDRSWSVSLRHLRPERPALFPMYQVATRRTLTGMGLGSWIKDQAAKAPIATWGDLQLRTDTIRRVGHEGGTYPLAGVAAGVEVGEALRKRVTLTRVATVGVFALAAKKKSGGESYLTVEGPEFFWTLEVDRGDQKKAREFAAKVNAAARQAQSA